MCPANGCRGEDCTRTTKFAALVPRNQHDFLPFDPKRAKAVKAQRRWTIAVDGMWLLDFGSKKSGAQRALKIIQHYGMNSQCFVGHPDPSMEFYLVNGRAPEGPMDVADQILR